MLHTFRSIRMTDQMQWDAVRSPGHPYQSWRFLLAVEEAKPENAEFWYLVFTDQTGQYQATAVLSAFKMSLSVLADGDPTIRRLEKIWPTLFQFKMLMCGIPVSAGQHQFAYNFGVEAAKIHEGIAQKMAEIAKEQKIKLLSIKELRRKDLDGTDAYLSNGYLLAQSPSSHLLTIRWHSFAAYLADLKHSHRRQIITDMYKMQVTTPRIMSAKEYDPTDEQPRWVIGGQNYCTPELFCTMYLEVLGHTKTKLETLETPFFEALFKVPQLELLSIIHKGKVISTVLLIQQGSELVWMFIGKYGEKDSQYQSYFNMMHGIIELAIQRGCKTISLGQTTDEPKMRRGGIPQARYFFIKATNTFFNRILRTYKKTLFPDPVLPQINPFNKFALETQSSESIEVG